jgi:2-desacetyl-2-hydroxyethyl bacteriochlorophyllide A dehydrogenase
MRCVEIKGPKELVISNREAMVGKPGYILIDVIKAGICGSDIHYWVSGEPKTLVMGHEFSGIVLDNGGSKDFNPGDRVTALPISPCLKCEYCQKGEYQICAMTWAEAIGLSLNNPGAFGGRVLVREDMVRHLPDSVTFEGGAMVEPASVAYRAVNISGIKKGDKCLVIGGGIIGLLTAMFLKYRGASYVGLTETNKLRGKRAVSSGVADEWFDALSEGVDKKIMERVNNVGYDVVCDCAGNSITISNAINYTRPNGNLILEGISLGAVNVPLVSATLKEINIKGSIAYRKDEFDEVIELLANKKIDIEKFIDDIVTLEDVQKSFERLTCGSDAAVKILVDPNKHKIVEI